MKKFFAIFLLILISANILGVGVTTHFCCGYAMASELNIGYSEITCGMESQQSLPCQTDHPYFSDSNCCENKYVLLQTDEPSLKLTSIIDLDVAAVGLVILNLPVEKTTTTKFSSFQYSPPLLRKNIPLLLQSFLI